MTTISLGKVAFTWQSTYNASSTYMKQDVVSYNGDSFVCVLDNTMGVTPTDASAAWDLFAQGTAGISNSSGQIIYNNGSGLVALPAGALGQVLTVGPTGLPVWATPEIRSGTKALRFPENTANTQSNLYRTMGVIMTDGSVRAWGQNSNESCLGKTHSSPMLMHISATVWRFSSKYQSNARGRPPLN